MAKARPAERATVSSPEEARRKGERRIVVDGVAPVLPSEVARAIRKAVARG